MDPTVQALLAIFSGLTTVTAITGLLVGLASKPINRVETALKDTERNLKDELTNTERRLETRLDEATDTLNAMQASLATINSTLLSLHTSQAALYRRSSRCNT